MRAPSRLQFAPCQGAVKPSFVEDAGKAIWFAETALRPPLNNMHQERSFLNASPS